VKDIVIEVNNLSKAYQLGKIGTGTISRDLERWWVTKVRGKEDPFLKIGETNDRSTKGTSDVVWSLKDINFEINRGDTVGIIGKNGAGKSTLFKLLSRVTGPTTGNIKIKGRVASLLEVGTGFHPELSGKENIYLNGAILGMRKKEIDRKFDEIVDFSGVERYIDTPVKRYSSGMYVRLAFAVAAHLESEIMIVDEVLAVGDIEFQKKCLGKMGEISQGEGRTILFVSHNLNAIRRLCEKGILLENGMIKTMGSVEQALDVYTSNNEELSSNVIGNEMFINKKFSSVTLEKIEIEPKLAGFKVKQSSTLRFNFHLLNEEEKDDVRCGFYLFNVADEVVLSAISDNRNKSYNFTLLKGHNVVQISFDDHHMMPGKYKIRFWIKSRIKKEVDFTSDSYIFEVENNFFRSEPDRSMGNIYTEFDIKTIKI